MNTREEKEWQEHCEQEMKDIYNQAKHDVEIEVAKIKFGIDFDKNTFLVVCADGTLNMVVLTQFTREMLYYLVGVQDDREDLENWLEAQKLDDSYDLLKQVENIIIDFAENNEIEILY